MTNSNNNHGELLEKTDFPKTQCWITHRVSYGETDMMNVVYYAEYLHYFERARNELIRNSGLSYKECELRGLFLPVREANCRYRSSARYDDLLQIRVGISEWNKASLKFIYEIYDETKTKLLATGFTLHACVNAESKPIAVPTWLKELFS
ncbi:acyl-CoA thioesterase [Desulfovibrio litoralis]|uniref:Acyl-CoA thioester hydrolase n=1 Tax=Desulfovibrio litoralis DSM 11393 TaxID=1121455 RepID=A0A1M7T1X7_9BACT|nr:thioesterase family protein [Desulfovibrio litoralis]SHN64664.1 acyl-CoA thioester hydrolase [Desulfovibrio litoralis DSM 11393]